MNLLTLSHIDEELDSSEVAALCFLCRDVLTKKRRQKVCSMFSLLTVANIRYKCSRRVSLPQPDDLK